MLFLVLSFPINVQSAQQTPPNQATVSPSASPVTTIFPATQAIPTLTTVPTTVPNPQTSPTIDPTVTALKKEILKNQTNWYWSNLTALISTLISGPTLLITAIWAYIRWRREHKSEQERRDIDHRIDQERRDEDRFQNVVSGLGSERIEARVGAAILLRTFLSQRYERFHGQAFDLAVAHLRLRHINPNKPEPVDSLSQALIRVFKESFPQVRNALLAQSATNPTSILDATGVCLDNAYLSGADLEKIWLRSAFLRKARLWKTNLSNAYLKYANLEEAFLEEANLSGADLGSANFSRARISRAIFNGARLGDANFTGATLIETHPEEAESLEGTILREVKGLSEEQLVLCQTKGAIVK